MKYFKVILLSLLLMIFMIGMININNIKTTNKNNVDYLRLHIRANSNDELDQKVKYKVKNALLDLITKDVSMIDSKGELEAYFNENKDYLEKCINNILEQNNFNYISNIAIQNEYFPTRTYNGVTLESGYYDAIIINLGEAKGNNWWCVAYPPLCFMYESSEFGNITYKSKLMEIIDTFFKR